MKIGLYNPYFDGYGGGELYMLTLASHWSDKHDVSIFWDDSTILSKSNQRFGLNLDAVRVEPNVFLHGTLLTKLLKSLEYDLIIFLSDGSVPFSLAKHNILHFQVPFKKVAHNVLKRFDAIVCNSLFTKRNLDPYFAKDAMVIYPPVRSVKPNKAPKDKIILSVGRFTSFHEAKKQRVMIETFIKMEKEIPGWKLVLVGGLLDSDRAYFNEIVHVSKNHAIDLLDNVSFSKLTSLYNQATIYWHSAGFGESNPHFAEHFGISTVEAMSAGCVPVVYADGGQMEIVNDKCGRLWKTQEELISKTIELIQTPHMHALLQKNAIAEAKKFSHKEFLNRFDKLLSSYEQR